MLLLLEWLCSKIWTGENLTQIVKLFEREKMASVACVWFCMYVLTCASLLGPFVACRVID